MHYAHILYVGKQNRQKYFLFPKFWRYFQFGVGHIMSFFHLFIWIIARAWDMWQVLIGINANVGKKKKKGRNANIACYNIN